MKSVGTLVLCAFVAAATVVVNTLAAPKIVQKAEDVKLLRYESNNDGLGNYNFVYEQSDSSSRTEEGKLRNAGTDNEFVAVQGSYSWTDPDGVYHAVDYIADENGYQILEVKPEFGAPAAVVASLLG
ncbi:hypothetical protein PYW07_015300 [Mythimna separata]|uniref:Uncharacterized protein n=1 Tax=Mythimna separata TaxID=271217 RepID=A0AAD7YYM5_MYTSE|nr:hypothetical protein PYW07_015300 [Mythimna separata]